MPFVKPSENIFLKSPSGEFTYTDLNNFTAHFKSYLNEKQIPQGKPIGLLTFSCDTAIFIVAACWDLGIPFICFNPDEKKDVLAIQITTLNPSIIFTDDKKLIDNSFFYTSINKLPVDTWINSEEKKSEKKEQPNSDVFAYFFTSGTTSTPKIVPLKRRQMLSAAKSSAKNIKFSINEYWLLCMPLNHIGGISIILRSLIYNSAVYCVDSFKIVPEILSNNEAVKAVSLVPTMLKRLLDDKTFQPHEQLKILLGGGPVHPALLKKAVEKNINVITSYGMTETCAQIAAGKVTASSIKAGIMGSFFEPNNVQIRNENGNLQKTNQPGLIWLKGPQVFEGYYQNVNQPFDNEGWFNTGDFGRLDNKGQLTIESRRTDLIITGGENVSPFEVEEALLSLREVKEAAVVGLPNEEWGQMVAAAVVTNLNNEIAANTIKKQLRSVLADYKIPKKIMCVNKLPRTTTGKIKRTELKKLF